LNGHNKVPSKPRRFGAALRRRARVEGLRAFATGLLRFSATSGGFDPRLPVIWPTRSLRLMASVVAMLSPPIPKVETDVPSISTFLLA
jgi:hypothetical protein